MVTRLQDFGSQRGPTASPIGKFAGGWVTHVPCLVAGVLVFAATAKAYELGHSFAGSSAFWIAGAWPAYLIAAELLLAAALIAGTWPHRAWEAATLLFAVFSAVSLSKVIAGDASCGCFGDVTVSPWIALIVDLVVLVLLVFDDPPPVATVRGGSTTSIVLEPIRKPLLA